MIRACDHLGYGVYTETIAIVSIYAENTNRTVDFSYTLVLRFTQSFYSCITLYCLYYIGDIYKYRIYTYPHEVRHFYRFSTS